MITGLDNTKVIEFVSTDDDDKNNPTIFLLGVIDGRLKISLITDAMDSKGNIDLKKVQGYMFDIVKAGLKGIKNWNGKDINAITDSVLDQIPVVIMSEIGAKLVEINFLGDQERKN